VYAGVPKVLHPDQFADIVLNYRILTGPLVNWVALTLPWLELIAGVLLILGAFTRAAAILATAMFATFTVALASAQIRHLDIACGCFDVAASSGSTSQSLVEAVVLLLASLALLALSDRSRVYSVTRFVQIPAARRRLALTALLVALAALSGSAMIITASRGASAPVTMTGADSSAGEASGAGNGSSTTASMVDGSINVVAGRDLSSGDHLAEISQAVPDEKLNVVRVAGTQGVLHLLSTGGQPDLLECRLDQLPWLAQRGYVQPIDPSRIPGWSRISEDFATFPGLTVGGETYAVPVDASVTGLIYREDRVADAPTSYRDLFAEQFKGKAAIENDPVAGMRLGAAIDGWASVTELSDEQQAFVTTTLKTGSPHFRAFYSDQAELERLFRSGKVVIAAGTAETARRLREKGIAAVFVAPREGLLVRGRALAIGAHSEDLGAAYALLTHYLSTAAQRLGARSTGNVPSRGDVRGASTLAEALDGAQAVTVTPPNGMGAWQEHWEAVTTEPPPGGG
jgi:spermidine/putrescine-binding protein